MLIGQEEVAFKTLCKAIELRNHRRRIIKEIERGRLRPSLFAELDVRVDRTPSGNLQRAESFERAKAVCLR
jgi:hypothetical protein